MVQITYNEAMTMLYLSQLIYDYHNNTKFDLITNESISDFIKRIYISNNDFNYIRESLFYLLHIAPDGKIIKYITNSDTNVQVAIIVSNINKKIVIVFKGSTSINDHCINFNFFLKQLEHFSVHSGFYNQVISVKKQIFNIIKPYIEKKYDLYLTGHSSGSANASLLGYFISEKYPSILIKIITFGGPRVGNMEWKKYFEDKHNIIHYRITNNNDIVTMIPTINYYHVGKEIFISDERLCFMKNYTCSFIWHNINDHNIIYYMKNMKNKEHLWNKLYSNSDINNDELELNHISLVYT